MKGIALIPPCAYQGGKQRLAKQIVDIIFKENEVTAATIFYDVCCGSGAVALELISRGINPGNIHMVDISPWGKFYQMLGDATFGLQVFKDFMDSIPKDITQIKPYALSILNKPVDEGMLVYHFLFLQACAFGSTATWVSEGKWCKVGGLRDYWLPTATSKRKSAVNPMMPMPDTLYERVEYLYQYLNNEINGYCMDAVEFCAGLDCVGNQIMYIDPPYQNTQQYGFSLDVYECIRRVNFPVYVSEGIRLEGAKAAYLLSEGRAKGNINGNAKKKPVEEYLNLF